ncbi:MAG: hypothetical protein AAFR66_17095 [Bacteroidota bacterium]
MKYDLSRIEAELEIPRDWETFREDNLLSVYNSTNGVGALQISAYEAPEYNRINLKDELVDYLGINSEEAKLESSNTHSYYNFVDNQNVYWRYWMIKKDGKIILASYNCGKEDIEIEVEVINKMIRSIL